MNRIYLDSPPVIYLVEQVMPFLPAVQARLSASGIVCVSSELTRMECLVLPLRNGDSKLVADFDTFFSSRVVELTPFPPAVFRRAAEIRAQFNFRTPDALHLAAAVEAACDVFLTNDAGLSRPARLLAEPARHRRRGKQLPPVRVRPADGFGGSEKGDWLLEDSEPVPFFGI